MAEPKVFDIKQAVCKIDGRDMTDVAPDGFGVSPKNEASLIEGLTGEVGFNMDPSTGAEATVTLKSTSPENAFLRDIAAKQQTGEQGVVTFEIVVKSGFEGAFGFTRKGMRYAMLQGFPEFSTDEKEAPDIEWKFVGYGYFEET